MATIKMEFYSDNDDDQGEYIANIEVSGDGDLAHFCTAARAFLIGIGFSSATVDEVLKEESPVYGDVKLNFDRSEIDE
jgi:hypothetical protein